MPSFCKVCGKETLQLCSGCKKVYYCCVACQRADWKKHKKQCKKVNAQQIKTKIVNNWSNFSKLPNWAISSDHRKSIINGSCQCEGIKYELLSTPREIQHCYCSICRKMHGSIYASWSPIKEMDIRFISKNTLTYYKSSDRVKRGFCNQCGSKIFLKYEYQRGLIWLTTALFQGNDQWYKDKRKMHIYCLSKAEYTVIPVDGNKRLNGT